MKNFADDSWVLPVGSLVVVDDADYLDPVLLQSLVELAAVRTNTKLLLITSGHDTGRGTERTRGEGVTAPEEILPWARHIGTPDIREMLRDNVIDRTGRHLVVTGAGVDGPDDAEAAELSARHTHQAHKSQDEVTASECFRAYMARNRERDRESWPRRRPRTSKKPSVVYQGRCCCVPTPCQQAWIAFTHAFATGPSFGREGQCVRTGSNYARISSWRGRGPLDGSALLAGAVAWVCGEREDQ